MKYCPKQISYRRKVAGDPNSQAIPVYRNHLTDGIWKDCEPSDSDESDGTAGFTRWRYFLNQGYESISLVERERMLIEEMQQDDREAA